MIVAGSPSLPPSGSVSSKRIAVFAATSWEVRAVRLAFSTGIEQRVGELTAVVHTVGEREFWLVQTGVGLERARYSAAQLFGCQSFHLTVSTGFACALVAAKIGELLIGDEVVLMSGQSARPLEAISVPGDERALVLEFMRGMVPSEYIGRFVSTDRVVGTAVEKKSFARRTEAIGLDMESSALALEARRAHVPFLIARTVSDLLDEDLPLDFNLFLRPTEWGKGLSAVLAAPSSLLGLGRLRRQSRIAAEALTAFFRHYATLSTTQG